ncbi:MAG: hypothetical protein V2A54_12235 [Bacteroidota bacterium]
MSLKNSLIILFLSLGLNTFSQSDSSSVYGKLETRKYYNVGLSSETINGKQVYKANGKKVSQSVYNYYNNTRKNIDLCRPCILKMYDENDLLVREIVQYSDCGVGWFKLYFANGKVKLIGQYKENLTNDWDNLWERGYCSIYDGQWTYFDETGDTLYSEFWDKGEFIKQVPEQKKTQIWRVDLTLDSVKIKNQILSIDQIKDLKITPRYKNNNIDSTNLSMKFQVSSVGYKLNEQVFSVDSFKSIDVAKMLSDVGIPPGKKTDFTLKVYNYDKNISNFYLNVRY